jgi:hypothetical protein
MSSISRLEIGLLILVVAIVLIPLGIVILAGSHSAYYTVSGEPVKDILEKKGINVSSITDTHWDVPGAMGGKTYVITDADNQQTIIATQNFDSEESRDAAIRTWHTSQAGRGKPAGNLIVVGQHIIVVSQPSRPIMDVIGPELTGNLKK